ncbi:unnamed protein product [Trichogramma brassicae]|uniref:Importin N-terminal domain-containing protein n=1 Tax=Trichogramma brassicae TaxID=86971 RepID=A0A6H5IEY0_9HYME|nr:unnamed protein product [Trichogramma brassicae]
MSGDIAQISNELAHVVEMMMSPNIPHQQRLEVYNACERFKETSPLCAQCGLFLAQKSPDRSPIVRHFGLQLMEHCIKYRWTQMSQPEKVFIKENAMKLLHEGTSLLQEENHIKDALSRIVVEMIKREWPQQWPNLLVELSEACTRGESQTELVLLVFLRLVEDVAILETLESNQRKKDIYQALTTNMTEIFGFFLRLMEQHYAAFQKETSLGRASEAAAHNRVVQVVLLTLSGFVEWVSITHIMAEEGRLLQILCLLLSDLTFRCQAAECLQQIVSRKGKVDDRMQLMILFTEDALKCMYAAATSPSPSGSNELQEKHFLFLKKLVQMLNGMATQLCSVWTKDGHRPVHFGIFLDTVMIFTIHSSFTLVQLSNAIWITFFKHEHIKTDSLLLTYIPKYIESIGPKLIKPMPQNKRFTNGTSGCFFEYDSDEEFNALYFRLRMDVIEGFRNATMVAPRITFSYVQQWLTAKIRKGMENLAYKSDPFDLEYLEWDALSSALEAVVSRILLVNDRPNIQSGLQLLELCLTYNPQDPWILSALLSAISALFVFLSMSTGSMVMPGVAILPRVLEKIYAVQVFNLPGETHENRSKSAQNVRRHASSLMVKIGQKYPLLLLPVFDQIHANVKKLMVEPSQLTRFEGVVQYEALMLISNHFCDYERQSKFIEEVIGQTALRFIAMGAEAFKGPMELTNFLGLNQPPIDNPVISRNMSDLKFCINVLLSVVKRSTIPDDPDRAENGNPVYRNPATPHIVPALPSFFALLRTINSMFTPAALSLLSESYKNVHDMVEVEKQQLLGHTNGNSSDSSLEEDPLFSPVSKAQNFFHYLQDTCYHLLGSGCHNIGRDFYQLQGLSNALINSVFSDMETIPDHRLRPIIRVFMKPFIYHCPTAFYETVLVPVLAHVSTHMHQRLSAKWQRMAILYEAGDHGEENSDEQEIIEDMLNRNLTREFIDVLKLVLVGGNSSDASPPDSMDQDNGGMAVDQPTTRSTNSIVAEVVSELGSFVLRHPSTCHSVVLCILGLVLAYLNMNCEYTYFSNRFIQHLNLFYSALSWNDSGASLKATMLTGPVVRALAADGSLNPQMASHIMVAVLQGLQLHGQHEANQGSLITLGAQIYEVLRPKFPNIIEVMQQIPGINLADLQRFDDKMSVVSTKGNKIEKGKKDLFKKITNQLIGRNIGQLFRKEVKIDNLPSIQIANKPVVRVDDISNTPSETGLTALFAGPT